MSKIKKKDWFNDVFEFITLSSEWDKCSSKIEAICAEFVKTKVNNEPQLHCLLHMLGKSFVHKYFPNVKLSYNYLKYPFVNDKELKELQNILLKEMKLFLQNYLHKSNNNQFMMKYQKHLSLKIKSLLPSSDNKYSTISSIKSTSKADINDSITFILSTFPKHINKLNELKGCELSGSLREFVWINALQIDKNGETKEIIENDVNNNIVNSNDNTDSVSLLIKRILQTAIRNMVNLGYDNYLHMNDIDNNNDKNKNIDRIEDILNKSYILFKRYSNRLSMITVHLHCSLIRNNYKYKTGSVYFKSHLIHNLVTNKIWDSDKCNSKSVETMQQLKEINEMFFNKLRACYKNVSKNIQLLELQQNKIPITLQSMIYEWYYCSFIGYLRINTLNYIWDQLFLYNNWDLLKNITIKILCKSSINQIITDLKVDDAIQLYYELKKVFAKLTVKDMKSILIDLQIPQ